MSYNVELLREARKEFNDLPAIAKCQVAEVLRGLSNQPRPHGCRKLAGLDGWRIRVGDYRILYTIDDDAQIIVVYRIGIRGNIYKSH